MNWAMQIRTRTSQGFGASRDEGSSLSIRALGRASVVELIIRPLSSAWMQFVEFAPGTANVSVR